MPMPWKGNHYDVREACVNRGAPARRSADDGAVRGIWHKPGNRLTATASAEGLMPLSRAPHRHGLAMPEDIAAPITVTPICASAVIGSGLDPFRPCLLRGVPFLSRVDNW